MMTWIIAVGLGVAIMAVSLWAIRLLAMPQPPEPDPEDVLEVEVNYRCTVCGMRLTVTHAQEETAAAPRHCREDMEPA